MSLFSCTTFDKKRMLEGIRAGIRAASEESAVLGGPQIKLSEPWSELGGPQSELGGPQNKLGGPQSQLGGPQSQVEGSQGGRGRD